MTPMCPYCGSDRNRRSGRNFNKFLRAITLRTVFRCRDCMRRFRPGGRLPDGQHRGFLRKHKRLAIAFMMLVMLAAAYGVLSALEMVPEGINYLRTEKLMTSKSGKKYTLGEAVDKTIEKSRKK